MSSTLLRLKLVRLWGLALFFLSMNGPWKAVFGQRVKEGCFDAGRMSCDHNPAFKQAAQDLGLNVNEICLQIALEIFPTDEILWDTSLHAEYINGIEANTELCSQIQIAYSQCIFCSPDEDFVTSCLEYAYVAQCGDQPTQEEVLQDDTIYAGFQTEADINATCEELEMLEFPVTMDLCERQKLVKHLCPGQCDGTCFDPNVYPPTCDPQAFQGTRNETIDNHYYCDLISYWGFYYADIDTVLNLSTHADHLRSIAADTGNETFCNNARQAYSECFWCFEEYCFDDTKPPSCEAPNSNFDFISDTTTLDLESIDEEHTCENLFWSFFGMEWPDDLYNISKHSKHLLVRENSTLCQEARHSYHNCFWCAQDVALDFCEWGTACSSNATIPNDFVSSTLEALNMTATMDPLLCDEIFEYWNSTWWDLSSPFTLQGCYDDIFLARLCPDQFCPEAEAAQMIDKNYLGATTTTQKRALIWVSRVSALLSFAGATYIIYDIVTDTKKRENVYHQLLIGMATFDIVTAVAWCFATAPIDTDDAYHVEGAMGNEATCKTQAFFIQLGFTSIFYNVSLAMYYVLVVAYGWREFQLKKIQHYMHGIPPLVGLGLAFGGLSSYHWIEYGCHLLPPPEGDLWPVLVFVVLPLGLSIAAISVSMLVVYCKVRAQAAVTKKWSFGISKASVLEQAVFWQCLFYVLAFYITWPILFSVYLASVDVEGPLGLTLTVAFVAPLQGFNNFLVYLRPKLKQRWGNRERTSTTRSSVLMFMRSVMQRRTMTDVSDSGRSGNTDRHDHTGSTDPSPPLAMGRTILNMDPSALLAMDRNDQEDQTDRHSLPPQLPAVKEAFQSFGGESRESSSSCVQSQLPAVQEASPTEHGKALPFNTSGAESTECGSPYMVKDDNVATSMPNLEPPVALEEGQTNTNEKEMVGIGRSFAVIGGGGDTDDAKKCVRAFHHELNDSKKSDDGSIDECYIISDLPAKSSTSKIDGAGMEPIENSRTVPNITGYPAETNNDVENDSLHSSLVPLYSLNTSKEQKDFSQYLMKRI